MDIVDYDIVKSDKKILVFIKIEDYPTTNQSNKLSYKSLNNVIYELSDGYCITDKRGVPLIIQKDLILCEKFLNEEYVKIYNVRKKLVLESGVSN